MSLHTIAARKILVFTFTFIDLHFLVINYEITVVTGDVVFAGTNAVVFIQIYGDKGKTEVITLESRSNNFERNTTEIFKVSNLDFMISKTPNLLQQFNVNAELSVQMLNQNFSIVWQIEAKDVGKIFKIRIGHNGAGIGSGWFLETVDVKHLIMALVPKEKKKEDKKKKKKKKKEEDEDEEGGEEMQEVVLTYHFPCSRWLAGGEEDGELVVELLPEDAEEMEGTKWTSF